MADKLKCALCGSVYEPHNTPGITKISRGYAVHSSDVCLVCLKSREEHANGTLQTGNEREWRSNIRNSTGR